MISPALFHPAFPIQPPPLRGTSFHRKEGVSTLAPSLGRGCRAQRGGVGFFFCGVRVLSLTAHLDDFPCSFSSRQCPIRPYGAPSPRGEGFVRRYGFSTYACIRFDVMGEAVFSYRPLPHWGRGTAPAALGYFRKLPALDDLPRSFSSRFPHPTSAPSGHLLP